MSGLHVVLLAKDRHAGEPMLLRFFALGAARGHAVRCLDKKSFLAADLTRADLVCLKSHVDDSEVWRKIDAHGVRAVNRRAANMACADRLQLDAVLREGGVPTPRSARTAADVEQLRLPIICKPKAASAPREVRVLSEPPTQVDCERWFYQELVGGDGVVCKAYCIADQTFLVEESHNNAGDPGGHEDDCHDPAALDASDASTERRHVVSMDPRLAEAARHVGRLTELEVYGLDFVGGPDNRMLIDVNPFPSFRCLPHAADALWDYLEKIGPKPRAASPRGRRIALVPGAFRPAHKVHLAAIVGLAARPDIDEVVVIIANRCRTLPGTTLALDAETAREVLAIGVRGVAKVRIEVARHNAVAHALGYLDHAAAGDTLLYCVGEADFDSGDDRFQDLLLANTRGDITAEVLPLPTGASTVRATALREALAAGDARRGEFMAALPEHLDDEQRMRVWSICRNGLREIEHIVEAKLRTLLDPKVMGDAPELTCVVPGKLDPVFRVRRTDGSHLFVKYAGETAEAGSVGHPFVPKPRRRLSCERRALACLRAQLPSGVVELADIVAFDKALSLQVQTEVCAGGRSLQDDMRVGRFDASVAAQAGRFLAACHAIHAAEVPALWGEPQTDMRHWHAMLDLRTVGIASAMLSPQQRDDLRRLRAASEAARRKGFFLLDATAKNIRVSGDKAA